MTEMTETLTHCAQESFDKSSPPSWNAASIRAALTRAIATQLRYCHLSADTEVLQTDRISKWGWNPGRGNDVRRSFMPTYRR